MIDKELEQSDIPEEELIKRESVDEHNDEDVDVNTQDLNGGE